ncbi:AraC family transcriptional regulator [Shouchella patagoniensis]|uniref:AraC family transcriptional regulator n=1 Tax=Shouchella patagoniensis TaxID=228576 RepID=UPI000995D9B7|nr:AraC family transcriptional regulator [Shouchella patagoniensis]
MNQFNYKTSAGVTALSAKMTDFTYKKHAHSEYAIGVTMRGIQHYHLDGHLQLSHQNGVMLFNPEQTHDGMAHDDRGLDYVMLYIEPQLLLESIGQKEIVCFSDPIVYDKKIQFRTLHLAKAILHQEDEAICSERLIELADSLFHPTTCSYQIKQDRLISKIKEVLRSHSKETFKIDDVCTEFGMSKFQFIRFFKAHTNITPYQYYLNSKIEGAKQLIEKERDIYLAVNEYHFVDLTHLNRQFKQVYGLTANEFVKNVHFL